MKQNRVQDPYGLIFDVDGVIADTEAVNARASIQVFAELFNVHGVQRKDFEAGLGRGAEEYMRAAARQHSLEPTPEQIDAATSSRQKIFLKILASETLPPFPGVVELMQAALARNDFRLAIATSSTREKSQAVLDAARIPYRQMVYITGSDVKKKKPDPELFATATRRIELPPQRCVVIEDAPDGILAAHSAGCSCIAVTNSVPAGRLLDADLVVKSLIQVQVETIVRLARSNVW